MIEYIHTACGEEVTPEFPPDELIHWMICKYCIKVNNGTWVVGTNAWGGKNNAVYIYDGPDGFGCAIVKGVVKEVSKKEKPKIPNPNRVGEEGAGSLIAVQRIVSSRTRPEKKHYMSVWYSDSTKKHRTACTCEAGHNGRACWAVKKHLAQMTLDLEELRYRMALSEGLL